MIRLKQLFIEQDMPKMWGCFGLLLLVLASYANSFPGVFILDDHAVVEQNPLVQSIDLVKIFTTDYWGEFANTGLHRPVTILSLGLNRLVLGADAAGFHLINLLLHAAITLLVFLCLPRFNIPKGTAWLAAALFAVHPIHTEVLNEVVGRSELLVATFILAALWLHSVSALRPVTRYCLVAACYALALFAKEHAVVLLVLLPLLDAASGAWRNCGWRRNKILYLLLVAETLLWLIWRAWGVARIVPPAVVEPAINPLHFMELVPRVLTALKIQWIYFGKLFWPADLHAIYSGNGWLTPVTGLLTWDGLTVVAATLLLLFLVGWGCRRGVLSAWGMALCLAAFAPTANLFMLTGVVMAERLAYLPSLWFCLSVAAALTLIPRRSVVLLLSLLLIGGLMVTTLVRNLDFSSEVTLWQDEVDRDPQNVLAWLALANSFDDKVRAEAYFRNKLAIVPDLAEGQSVYAGALYALGKYDDEVIAYALRAEADPKTDLQTNKFLLAKAYQRKGEYAESLYWLEKSRPMYGSYGVFWEVRGMDLEGLGRFPEAIEAYRRAAPLPADSEMPMRLGNLLMSQGRYAEAEETYRQGTRQIDRADRWNGLGVALALQGKQLEAQEAFRRAVSLEPGSGKYRENYQRALRSAPLD